MYRPLEPPRDTFARPLTSLRISVTDRCDLRCGYCMPEEHYVWLPRRDLLSFEEIARVARVFVGLGVDKLRLTGGEPLLRRDLPVLVEQLAGLSGPSPGLGDLAMTTNGLGLGEHAAALRAAGLGRITVSLDTLRPERFRELARRDALERVLAAIEAAREAGFGPIKLDTVVLAGRNDDELVALIEYARSIGGEVRFIEYMDVGGATRWSEDLVVARDAMLARLTRRYGPIEPVAESSSAPAVRYRLPDGTVFGIIASTTAPFCRSCDRSRLTADGVFFTCLYAPTGLDLRTPLRDGASDVELAALLTGTWRARTDRGAEERQALRERHALADADELRLDPHREMHTRGG